MLFRNVLLLFLAAVSLDITCHATCPVRLPKDEPDQSYCKIIRKQSLNIKRGIFGIRRANQEMPYDGLDMNPKQYFSFLRTDPFLAAHSALWIKNSAFFKGTEKEYLKRNCLKGPDMTTTGYADLRKFYRNCTSSPLNPMREYMAHPSTSQLFQSDFTKWISDHFFAEQRLSGVNPMTIQKVTFSNRIGLRFEKLEQLLRNSTQLLARAVKKVIGKSSLRKAVEDGLLFVHYQPLSRNLESQDDKTNNDPKRKMWKFESPIAIFVSRPENDSLVPVLIKMDDEREAPVYTPQDGDNWILAKLNVQLADLSTSQIIEHLCKVHLTIEAVCLAVERQLSEKHPLYDFMRFHCRGVFTVNTLGGPILLDDGKDLDNIEEFGNEGAVSLVKKAAEIINWDDLDFKNNIKNRGVDIDNERLPYYPYRDDGLVIYDILENMVRDYVHTFYPTYKEVKLDDELQRFAHDISKNGNGSLRGFPASITRKDTLIKTFTRILWIMIGQHTAINYPQADYASYIPNIPTKLYDVEGVAKNKYSTKRLDNRKSSAKHLTLVSILSTLRMDRLFDYGDQLRTREGKRIVNYYKDKLKRDIEPKLLKRNKERLEQGHLTYPYFQPSWLTNGIQA